MPHSETSLMLAPTKCRHMQEEILCICCVRIPKKQSACEVGFVSFFYHKHGASNIETWFKFISG